MYYILKRANFWWIYLKTDMRFWASNSAYQHSPCLSQWVHYRWLRWIWLCAASVQPKIMIRLKNNICMSWGRLTFKVRCCTGPEEQRQIHLTPRSTRNVTAQIYTHISIDWREKLHDRSTLDKNSIYSVFFSYLVLAAIIAFKPV